MLNRTNRVLAVLLGLVLVAAVVMRPDYSRRNIEVLPEMKYSPAAAAFEENAFLPDGRTLQPPVAGTIPRGQLPLHYRATPEDAERAGRELRNPLAISPVAADSDDESAEEERARHAAAVDRGRELFQIYCAACHGPGGAGDGPVTQRGFPPPPSLLTGVSRQAPDGRLFHILTYGQGSMAPMAGQLSRQRRWEVILYLRELQQAAPVPTEPLPADNAEETEGDRSPVETETTEDDGAGDTREPGELIDRDRSSGGEER